MNTGSFGHFLSLKNRLMALNKTRIRILDLDEDGVWGVNSGLVMQILQRETEKMDRGLF